MSMAWRIPLPAMLFRPPLEIRLMADDVHLAAGAWSARQRVAAGAATPGDPAWGGAVRALGELLAAGSGGARRARVLLADRFVRYCLIPREAGLARPADLAAWARHAFRAEYGAAVEGWRVCVDTDTAGASIAALIETGLHQGLTDACAKAGLRLESLAPHFAATQARLAARVRERAAWFAVVESGHLAAGLRAGGTWQHFVTARLNHPGAAPDAAAVAAALAAQSLGVAAARTVRTLHLATPSGTHGGPGAPDGWTVNRWLDPCAVPR
jgi:hypothetical protein